VVDPVVSDDPDRTISFGAVFNFRDLGGYAARDAKTVRWRRLFRADGLNRLRSEDGDDFRALGIATVIDLRTGEEVERRGRFPSEIAHVDYHHLPLFDTEPDWLTGDPDAPGFLAARYADILDAGRDAVGASLDLLARAESYPLVFHCMAGKDRTGILAGLILGLLGVPDHVVAHDYAMSHEAMQRLDAWVAEHLPEDESPKDRYPPSVLAAHPETMSDFLRLVRERHGSLEALVGDIGLGDDVVDRVRGQLLVALA
jgi:protein-tyrosine phosphatase